MDDGLTGVNIYSNDGYEALKVGCTANENCYGADSGVTPPTAASPAGGAVAAVVIVLLMLSVAPAVAFVVWHKFRKKDDRNGMLSLNEQESEFNAYGSTNTNM